MTNFYEFNKHEYYALIKAETAMGAIAKYVEVVAGDSVDDVWNEGIPDLITYYDALVKFGMGVSKFEEDITFEKVWEEFLDKNNEVLLVDGSLL